MSSCPWHVDDDFAEGAAAQMVASGWQLVERAATIDYRIETDPIDGADEILEPASVPRLE